MTLNGKILYSRYILRPCTAQDREKLVREDGVKSIAPLDCYLGVADVPFKMTTSMMLKIAYWAQNQCSYRAAEKALGTIYGVFVNDSTIRHVTNYIGELVFQKDCRLAQEAYELLESAKMPYHFDRDGIIYIETDGASVNTRIEDENGSTWRENKLGMVFTSDNIRWWTDKKKKESRHRILKKEYISYIGNAEEFKKHLFACALRNGYGTYKETVILSDGATWIRNMVEELYPDAQHILDYFHLCENVNEYAKHLFNMDELKYKPWAESVCKALKESGYRQVLKELESFKDKNLPQCHINLFRYISNNIKNIDYAAYQQKGYFIGSGGIESANKTILQRRLKQAGMRWDPITAQYILSLITKEESNLWEKDVADLVYAKFEYKSRFTYKK